MADIIISVSAMYMESYYKTQKAGSLLGGDNTPEKLFYIMCKINC